MFEPGSKRIGPPYPCWPSVGVFMTSPLGWLLVFCLYKEVYLQIFKRVSFWLHGCCGEWEVGPVNQVNHTSWVAVVTPTERPKSVRNRCVIELFCGVVCVVTLPFWHFCWCRGFCHRTESDLFPFLFEWALTIVNGVRAQPKVQMFCNPPAHLCAVTYATKILSAVMLNNQCHSITAINFNTFL